MPKKEHNQYKEQPCIIFIVKNAYEKVIKGSTLGSTLDLDLGSTFILCTDGCALLLFFFVLLCFNKDRSDCKTRLLPEIFTLEY